MRNVIFLILLVLITPVALSQGGEKLRVIIETDAGGDPDDEQSLVRFLLYANEWDVVGIIANRPTARPGENRNPVRTGLGIVRQHLDAYGEVHPRLAEHAEGYPTKEKLWDRAVSGYEESEDGVNLIIAAADRDDPRPIWFQNWGTDRGSAPSSLLRALDKVRAERGEAGYATFKQKFRLCSSDKFGEHTSRIEPPFVLWVLPSLPNLDGGNWYHRFGPLTATAGGFDLERDVRTGHGPLGALYPTNTNIRQKEGDSHYFIYLIPNGLSDPEHPTWGSWAGRFGVRDDAAARGTHHYWANQRDTLDGTANRDHTLRRFAADLQNDFRARMDWCVKPRGEANHPPAVVLNGDRSTKPLRIDARPGETVPLSAAGSSDPDGNALRYEWWAYREAGTYSGDVRVAHAGREHATALIPEDAAGKEIHVIVTVRDDGAPELTRYRRAVLRVSATVGGR